MYSLSQPEKQIAVSSITSGTWIIVFGSLAMVSMTTPRLRSMKERRTHGIGEKRGIVHSVKTVEQ